MYLYIVGHTYKDCADLLDEDELVSNITNGLKILKLFESPNRKDGEPKAALSDPGVKMWQGYEKSLISFINVARLSAARRGIDVAEYDEPLNRFAEVFKDEVFSLPNWYHNAFVVNKIIRSHRSMLYKIRPDSYEAFAYIEDSKFDKCHPHCKLYWPVTHRTKS